MGQQQPRQFPQPAEIGSLGNQNRSVNQQALPQTITPQNAGGPMIPQAVPMPTISSPYSTPTPNFGAGGGGGGSCFSGNVGVRTPEGYVKFSDLPHTFKIENLNGIFTAEILIHDGFERSVIVLDSDKFVTTDHLMKEGDQWVSADLKYPDKQRATYWGTLYNMHVISDDPQDHHYIIFNGDVAHNLKQAPDPTGMGAWDYTRQLLMGGY